MLFHCNFILQWRQSFLQFDFVDFNFRLGWCLAKAGQFGQFGRAGRGGRVYGLVDWLQRGHTYAGTGPRTGRYDGNLCGHDRSPNGAHEQTLEDGEVGRGAREGDERVVQ